MAIVVRRRRRRRTTWLSGALKRYTRGFLFLAFGIAILTGISLFAMAVPEFTLEIPFTTGTNTTSTLTVSNKLIINVIGWALGIIFIITAIRRFGIFV
jgi:hypothetical protein